MSVHGSHPAVIKRLKRASGHLQSVIKMIEEEKSCLEITQQIYAVESAITNAKKVLIHDHLDHCLEHALENNKSSAKAVKEFKEITKYL
jgi:DNA-binding FrmR family transcriptional regulator